MSRPLRRFSGIIYDGEPIETLSSEARRAYFGKLNKNELVNLSVQMSETINRLWEIYRVREGLE